MIYILLLLAFMNDGSSVPVLQGFNDVTTCKTAEASILDDISKSVDAADAKIVVVNDCIAVPKPVK